MKCLYSISLFFFLQDNMKQCKAHKLWDQTDLSSNLFSTELSESQSPQS